MASDLYKITTFFSGKKKGWTESWILPLNASQPGNIPPLLNTVNQLRANLLGAQFQIDATRISKIRLADGTKLKRNVFLQEQPFVPNDLSTANAADAPDACVIGNAIDISGAFRKQFFLGAPPDAIIVNGGDLNQDINGWRGKFTSWAAEMSRLQMSWLNRQVVKLAGNDFSTISGYVVALSGIVTFTCDAGTWGAGPYQKQTVSIRGLNSSHSNLNGQLLIIPTSDTTFKTIKARPSLPFSSDGYLTHYLQPYPNLVGVLYGAIKAGNHKRGRPLLVSPGRRAAIVRV